MSVLFEAIYQAWQAGKITESEFSEALSLILAGQDPKKGAVGVVNSTDRITYDLKRKRINEIRALS